MGRDPLVKVKVNGDTWFEIESPPGMGNCSYWLDENKNLRATNDRGEKFIMGFTLIQKST